MFNLIIENVNGEKLQLTQNESNYQVASVSGMQPPTATINMSKNANVDGSTFNSSFLNERNIVILVALKGDIEKNRLNLYQFLGSGSYCKIYYSNNGRNIYCEGYVETVENDLFSKSQQVQVSIICGNPFLYDLELIHIDISKNIPFFEFPFAIDEFGVEVSTLERSKKSNVINVGEAATGLEITMFADLPVINPVIYNEKTGAFLKLNTTIDQGEKIIINTNKGKKSIKRVIREKEAYNIVNSLVAGSTWHQLEMGNNVFVYSADTNDTYLHVEFSYNLLYKGV